MVLQVVELKMMDQSMRVLLLMAVVVVVPGAQMSTAVALSCLPAHLEHWLTLWPR